MVGKGEGEGAGEACEETAGGAHTSASFCSSRSTYCGRSVFFSFRIVGSKSTRNGAAAGGGRREISSPSGTRVKVGRSPPVVRDRVAPSQPPPLAFRLSVCMGRKPGRQNLQRGSLGNRKKWSSGSTFSNHGLRMEKRQKRCQNGHLDASQSSTVGMQSGGPIGMSLPACRISLRGGLADRCGLWRGGELARGGARGGSCRDGDWAMDRRHGFPQGRP